MLGELILIVIIGMIIYYTYKYVTGTLATVVTGVVALYVIYIIYTQVLYGEVPSNIKIPDRYLENDIKIEEMRDKNNKYEYR